MEKCPVVLLMDGGVMSILGGWNYYIGENAFTAGLGFGIFLQILTSQDGFLLTQACQASDGELQGWRQKPTILVEPGY